MGNALPTLDLIREVNESHIVEAASVEISTKPFIPEVELDNVTYKFEDAIAPAISNFTLRISPGESVALVGPSGAGKSTLVDIILGLRTPSAGAVTISGDVPENAIKQWPNCIAYVPQDVEIINGTIRENISLGFPKDWFTDTQLHAVIKNCELTDFVTSQPYGLDTHVGEFGSKISGGQRQRIGLARALVTSPKIIFLDEATSALDGETEFLITDSLKSLKGIVTVVLIAHRLSTVKDCDKVVYIDLGRLMSVGTFSEVREAIPNFDYQAKLMGL